MARRFIEANRKQGFLLPPSIEEWLPNDHLARYIVEIIDQLNLSAIYGKYGGKGGVAAYDPKMLLGLLFYGYATGVFSSRRIEQATYDSVAFRYIGANSHPDHDTIATFRHRFLPELESLFVQILMIARETGILKVGRVSLDGTKVKANASRHKALSYAHAQNLEKQLETEVKQLMHLADKADGDETSDGMNIPKEITRREDRLRSIKAAKARIEARAEKRYEEERTQYEEKMRSRRAKEEQSGRKPRGKEPKAPEKGPRPKDQVNLTDEESRIMPVSGGGFEQAYNAQASVEHDSRLIVHGHVTQNVNDKQEIEPALRWFTLHPELKPDEMLNDAGYFSEANVQRCEADGIIPYISMGKERHNQPPEGRFKSADPLSENPTPLQKMQHRLQTPQGKQIYAQRKSTVEPVFGIMKHVMGFRQFLLRGFEKAKGEWNLVCLAYNLKRLHTISIRK